jgi:tetratricopeptide (TPR) repeat protein
MNKRRKTICLGLLLLFITLQLSCVATERDHFQDQVTDLSEVITNGENDAFRYAYKSYALACIAILDGDYGQGEIHLKEALKSDEGSSYLLIKVSEVLLKQGEEEEALDFAKKAVHENPGDIDAKMFLAGFYTRLQKFESAVSQYQDILVNDPGNKEVRLKLSALFIRLKDFNSAVEHLAVLIKDDPGFLIAHYYMGRINLERGDYGSAEKAFLRVLEINPEFLPALFDSAVLYGKMDRFDLAIECYERIVAISPKNATANEQLISLLYKTGQDQAAEKAIAEMEKNLRPDGLERKTLGLIYLKYGKLDKSIAEFRAIVAAFPEDQEARYYLGAALHDHKDFDAAYENLSPLGPESDYFVRARIRMAYILQGQDKIDDAIEVLKEAISIKQGHSRLYLMLSTLYEGREQYKSAMSILEEGLTHNERDTDLLYRMGIVLDKLKRNEECLEHMERILIIDPTHADALNYIGYSYADKGIHLDRAQEMIEKALKYKPGSGYIIDSLGWVYFQKGHYDMALIELKRAVKLTPKDPVINEHLGDVYFKIKQYETALEVYNRALVLEDADTERLKVKIKEVLTHIKKDDHQ